MIRSSLTFLWLGMIGCVWLSPAILVHGQDLRSMTMAEIGERQRLADQLKALRRDVGEQQSALADQLRALEKQTAGLEDELESSRAARDSASLSLESLASRVDGRRREYDYIYKTLFPELSAIYQSTISPGELNLLGESLRQMNLTLEDEGQSPAEKARASVAFLDQVMDRVESLGEGRRYRGSALNGRGEMLSGEFLQYGPLSYFQSSGTTDSGLVQESGSGKPLLVSMGKSEDALIREFMNGGAEELPVDASLGDVVAVTETRDSLMEHLRKGGLWVYPILAFALVAFVVSVVKLVQIFSVREPRPMVVHDMVKAIRAGDIPAAEKLAQSVPAPAREMLLAAAAHAGESIELVEEVMYECMLSVQPRLERFLNIIAVTAATAPLLGLLGTVTGIIQTFSLMRIFGAGDPKPLLSGISEALITTELGLILAIPSLVIHSLLSRRVAGILSRMEKLSVAFVNGLSRRDPVKASTADGVE